jgi:hypothetical protein
MLSLSFCSPELIPGEPGTGGGEEDGDIYEYDNVYYEASTLSLGYTQEHTIHEKGDVDYIRFYAENGLKYRIHLYDISGFEPEVTLYENDGSSTIMMKNADSAREGTIYDWWGHSHDPLYEDDDLEKESLIFTSTESGYHYVSVKDVYNVNFDAEYTIGIYEMIEIGEVNDLVATASSTDLEINITWSAITGVDGYHLYKTDEPQADINNPNYSDFTKIQTISSTNYTDTNIEPNTTYYYYITGYVDTEEGEPSNTDDAMFTFGTVPDDLDAYVDNYQVIEITVNWSAISGVEGYRLYRTSTTQADINNPNYNDFSLIQTLSSTSYTDTNISPDVNYYYYIEGYNNSYTTDPSNADDAEFVWANFIPENTIEASQGYSKRVVITLKQTFSNVLTYEIWRAKAENVPSGEEDIISHYTHISALDFPGNAALDSEKTNGITGETGYTLSDLEANKYYYYKVRVVLTGGEQSNYSYYDNGLATN